MLTFRSSSVQVREDNSYFLRIEREDFKRILLSVESTTIKFTEQGKEVLVLEKALWGQYLVVKGTAERMLDHLLESEIEKGSQEGVCACVCVGVCAYVVIIIFHLLPQTALLRTSFSPILLSSPSRNSVKD